MHDSILGQNLESRFGEPWSRLYAIANLMAEMTSSVYNSMSWYIIDIHLSRSLQAGV